MKGKQTALMPGNEDRVGYWLTPPDLMAKLQAEFDFDFDACPYPRPAGFLGVKAEWGYRTWVNPPFKGSLAPWIRKAVDENRNGKLVVMVLPIHPWMETLLEAQAEMRFLGRVPWRNPAGESTPRPKYPSAIFILRPRS